jgi:ferric-dicitrate binding protein FerR (iron transport regulator)
MTFLLKLIERLWRPSKVSGSYETDVDALLDDAFGKVRRSDTDTHRQWARLSARIATKSSGSLTDRPRLATGLAFAVVAVAAAAVFVTSREPLTDRYSTARGEQTQILLPDSSSVTLNHTSELFVRRFGPGDERRMMLAGEALFLVRKNRTPFIVSNGFAEVAVVGTEFNVRSRDERLEVAVLHGTVRVTGTDHASSMLTLTAGQRAIVRRGSAPLRIDDIPSPDFPGWMHGKLFLTRVSLEEACQEVEARFDVSVRVSGTSPGAITGVLEASSADAALRSLSLLTGKDLRRDHETYVLE